MTSALGSLCLPRFSHLFLTSQWKIVSGSACPNTCVSIGGNWRKDTLAAIERHEAGVALQSELMITASAKLIEMQSLQSRKQDELESLRVPPLSNHPSLFVFIMMIFLQF